MLKKLSSLYGGSVTLPEKCDNFVNLSSHELTPDQKELLNLGLQCNFYPRANQQEKKAELELLYEQICEKHKAGKIRVNPDVQAQLLSESTKQRGSTKSRLVTPRLREAAKELRNNSDLIIRRADKSSVFVLLDRSDYISKVNVILKDTTKFEKLTRNPIEKQKKDLNAVIDAANAEQGGVKFQRLQGEFSTGYFYGNPKTHKEGAPIRPIISQIPTPAYNVAKQLNSLIAPYVPKTYSLRSSEEFLDILKVRERHGTLASLTRPHYSRMSLSMRRLASFLRTCILIRPSLRLVYPKRYFDVSLRYARKIHPSDAQRVNFTAQIDGVAMGSPLGVLFAEAYMARVESLALESMEVKPFTYCRYIDDIFVDVVDEDQLMCLKSKLEEKSLLKFTVEMSVNNRIPFLDVTVDASGDKFVTSVYRKPTDDGQCLNGLSESPGRYKESVVRAYIHRALTHCTTWPLVHQELERIRNILVNNNFSLTDIDNQIKTQLHKHFGSQARHSEAQPNTNIKLFYRNRMSTAYKADEKALRDIIARNCIPSDPETNLRLIIYYKSPKTSNLVMNNNLSKDTSVLKASNVVYEFKCTAGDCARRSNSTYIGYTTTSLSRRLTMHLQTGAPKQHMRATHNSSLTRSILVENTSIIATCFNVKNCGS